MQKNRLFLHERVFLCTSFCTGPNRQSFSSWSSHSWDVNKIRKRTFQGKIMVGKQNIHTQIHTSRFAVFPQHGHKIWTSYVEGRRAKYVSFQNKTVSFFRQRTNCLDGILRFALNSERWLKQTKKFNRNFVMLKIFFKFFEKKNNLYF